jgi:hypothetical protein
MNLLSRINNDFRYRRIRHKTIGRILHHFRKTNIVMFHIGRSGSFSGMRVTEYPVLK